MTDKAYYNLVRYENLSLELVTRSYLIEALDDQRKKFDEVFKLMGRPEVTHHLWNDADLEVFKDILERIRKAKA